MCYVLLILQVILLEMACWEHMGSHQQGSSDESSADTSTYGKLTITFKNKSLRPICFLFVRLFPLRCAQNILSLIESVLVFELQSSTFYFFQTEVWVLHRCWMWAIRNDLSVFEQHLIISWQARLRLPRNRSPAPRTNYSVSQQAAALPLPTLAVTVLTARSLPEDVSWQSSQRMDLCIQFPALICTK